MISPPHLKAGDLVYIVSTARKIEHEKIALAQAEIESWGLKVKLGKNLFSEENQFAGSDKERAADFQQAMDDSNCKAIFCARGGYGTVRLMEHLNFDCIQTLPKWVIGYSDITVLHAHLQEVIGIESMHATMPINFPKNSVESLTKLKDVLFGEKLTYNIPSHKFNRGGNAMGKLLGGNLSILYSLNGSESFPNMEGNLLFIEDLDEYLYHIDRMMMNLKRSGCFEKLGGLIVGGMSDMNDNDIPFGKTAEEIIRDAVAPYKFPVCFGFPAGHLDNNLPLIMGRSAELSVQEDRVSLAFSSSSPRSPQE